MFLQIADWFIKFVGIIGNVKVLSSSANRRKIGKLLVELHVLLSKIINNSELIKEDLERKKYY